MVLHVLATRSSASVLAQTWGPLTAFPDRARATRPAVALPQPTFHRCLPHCSAHRRLHSHSTIIPNSPHLLSSTSAMAEWSGAVRLADLNDYLGPSQACIKPMMIKPKDEHKDPTLASPDPTSSTAADTLTNPNPKGSNRGQIVSIQLEAEAPARPSLLTSTLTAPPAFNQMKVSTKKTATVSLNDCLACSGCVTSAETVLIEQQSLTQLAAHLAARAEGEVVVVSVSPQSMASLAVKVGLDVMECERRLLTLLRSIGVHELVECRQYNDVAIMEAADEFTRHFQASRDSQPKDALLPLPLLASECPGWVCYAEKTQGSYILPHMSAVKSPQQLAGLYLRRHYAATRHVAPQDVYHVSIQPCFDKKLEGRSCSRRTRNNTSFSSLLIDSLRLSISPLSLCAWKSCDREHTRTAACSPVCQFRTARFDHPLTCVVLCCIVRDHRLRETSTGRPSWAATWTWCYPQASCGS